MRLQKTFDLARYILLLLGQDALTHYLQLSDNNWKDAGRIKCLEKRVFSEKSFGCTWKIGTD